MTQTPEKLLPRPKLADQHQARNYPVHSESAARHLSLIRVGYKWNPGNEPLYWDNASRLGKAEPPYCVLQIGLAGAGYVYFRGTRMAVTPGMAYLFPIPSPTSYRLDWGQAWEWVWVSFRGDAGFACVRDINRRAGYIISLLDHIELIQATCDLYDDMARGGERNFREQSADLYRILLGIDAIAIGEESPINPVVDEALGVVERRFADAGFGLDELARECGRSKYHLVRLFKEAIGQTPGEVIRIQRLQEARDLLAMTRLSIKEICYRVGYSNPTAFTAAFKREFGATPSSVVRAG